jgi:uncharacterized protein YrrD
MHFKENADLLTADGKTIGRIDRIVIDPGTEEVTHLVAKKGLLFTRDKVVPIDQVDIASEEQVRLKRGAPEPDEFPDFEETEHIPIGSPEDFSKREAEKARGMIWYHTRISIPWWGAGPSPNLPKPLFVKRAQRNIPEGSIPLDEGAKVIDVKGDPVGNVAEVYAEPQEHRVTHILVSSGTLFKEKKLIPSAWVKEIFEDSVRLKLAKKVIENLPDAECAISER